MKKSSILKLSIPALTLFLLAASTAVQQRAQSASERSYLEARKVLDAGIEAQGGLQALRGIQNVSRKGSGIVSNQGQSLKPLTTAFQGGIAVRARTLLKGDAGSSINLVTNVATPLERAAAK